MLTLSVAETVAVFFRSWWPVVSAWCLSIYGHDGWNEHRTPCSEGGRSTRRHELLAMYGRPPYIFTDWSVRHAQYMRFLLCDSLVGRVSGYSWRYDFLHMVPSNIVRMRTAEGDLEWVG